MIYKVKLVGSSKPSMITADSFKSATRQFVQSTSLPDFGWIIASDERGKINQFCLENGRVHIDSDTIAIQTVSSDSLARSEKTPVEVTARISMLAAWILAGIALFSPAYSGEFLTPGGEMDVIGLVFLFGSILFSLAGVSHGNVDSKNIMFLIVSITPVVLLFLTPWSFSQKLSHLRISFLIPGVILFLCGATWGYSIFFSHHISEEIRFGCYLMPFPIFLAGIGFCLLGIEAITKMRKNGMGCREAQPTERAQ